MAECIYCKKKKSRLQLNSDNVCDGCFESYTKDQLSKRTATNRSLVNNFMAQHTEDPISFFVMGYTSVENNKSMAKDVGRAFLSGAVGLAAPFLVGSTDFSAQIVFVALTEKEMFHFIFDRIPLEGINSDLLSVTEEHFNYFLSTQVKPKTTEKGFINDIEYFRRPGSLLFGSDKFNCQIYRCRVTLPDPKNIAGNATADEMINAISGLNELMTPADLFNAILTNQPLPTDQAQEKMGSNKSYVNEFILSLEEINNNKKERSDQLMLGLKKLHSNLKKPIIKLVEKESQNAVEGTPKSAKILFFIGIPVIPAAIFSIIRILLISDTLEKGSLEASGIIELGSLAIATILLVIATCIIDDNKKRVWYKKQKHMLTNH